MVVSPEDGGIQGWQHDDWGDKVDVDLTLDEVEAGEFDALLLPGGQMNPDILRMNPTACAAGQGLRRAASRSRRSATRRGC